jgi:hypothetical protein
MKGIIFAIWSKDLEINIVEDPGFCEKYETKFEADAFDNKCELIDKKLKDILSCMAAGIADVPDLVKDAFSLFFGSGKTLPKNFYYEFEVKRLNYCNNLVFSK